MRGVWISWITITPEKIRKDTLGKGGQIESNKCDNCWRYEQQMQVRLKY